MEATSVRRSQRQRRQFSYAELVDNNEAKEAHDFDIMKIVEADEYPSAHVVALNSSELSLEYIVQHGFTTPLFLTERDNLNMKVPPPDFSIAQRCCGAKTRSRCSER
eukprot:m.204395 g.204395  ORF g.204395 m.204395 type:complete len:107 (-) comp16885_c0_seq3:1441-1761(-)